MYKELFNSQGWRQVSRRELLELSMLRQALLQIITSLIRLWSYGRYKVSRSFVLLLMPTLPSPS
jgi:hypothetical protein